MVHDLDLNLYSKWFSSNVIIWNHSNKWLINPNNPPQKKHIIQVQLWDTLVEFKWTKVNNRPSCVLWYLIRCRSIYHVPRGKHQFHSSLTKGVQTVVSLSTSGDKCVRSPRLDTNTPDWNCPLLAGVCKIPSTSSSFWDGGTVASEMGSNWSLTRSHSYQNGFCGLQVLTELLFREHEQRRPNGFQRRPLGVISLLPPWVFNVPAFTWRGEETCMHSSGEALWIRRNPLFYSRSDQRDV